MSDYDAFRKVIEHEANQDDDGGFFARLGGLEPDPEDDDPTARGLFQHWDTERDGPAVKWPPRDNGGKLPVGPQWMEWVKEHQEILRKINRNPRYLQPIVKVRSGMTYYRNGFGYKWNWTCRLCYRASGAAYWDLAYESADRHARNHHRSQ